MSVNVQYEASSGNIYNLKAERALKIKEANFHNYEWTVETTDNRFGVSIDRFAKDPIVYPVTLMFMGTYAQNKEHIEALHADFERDILNETPGRLIWGACYIQCYARASSTYPDETNIWTRNEVEFYCPYPFWIQEYNISIAPVSRDDPDPDANHKKYTYQYDYSYKENTAVPPIDTHYYAGFDFRMVAYGPFDQLYVTISGNVYNVDYQVGAAEYMVIDSRQHGIYKGQAYVVDNSGRQTSVFDYRNPNYSLYAKIPPGLVEVSYTREYGVDLTFFMERSEPVQVIQ